MRFQDLSPADQALVRTDFGAMDKVAAGLVKQATECYEYGHDKIALEIADGLEKAAADEAAALAVAEKTAGEVDPEFEKAAAELGAFTERGTFDGLAKLGQERYGDEMAYFYPFVEQKIAQAGAQAALAKVAGAMKSVATHGAAAVGGAAALAGAAKLHGHMKKRFPLEGDKAAFSTGGDGK